MHILKHGLILNGTAVSSNIKVGNFRITEESETKCRASDSPNLQNNHENAAIETVLPQKAKNFKKGQNS